MSSYWKDRYIEEYNKQFTIAAARTEAEMARQYKIIANKLKAKLKNLYNELLVASQDGTLLVSDLYKYQRYWDLLAQSNQLLTKLGEKQIEILEPRLKNYYNQVSKQIAGTNHFNNNIINQEAAEKAVNSIWCADGKNWSDRIWADKRQLLSAIEQGITEAVATGAKTDDAIKILMQKFNASFSNAERLVRTEMSHVQNEACLNSFQEASVEEVQFLDTEDERTCEECQKLDGTIYSVADARAVIPVHCNCRCTWLAVLKKEAKDV